MALCYWLMGCGLGESQRGEEAHRTSNILKSDASRVESGERLDERQELMLVVGS